MEFNRISEALHALAASHGLSKDDLRKFDENDEMEWCFPFWGDLDESFGDDMTRLQAAFALYEKAIERGDLLAANAGLQRARLFSQNLASLFDALRRDLGRASTDSRFDWPTFPENYTIPPEYDYKG